MLLDEGRNIEVARKKYTEVEKNIMDIVSKNIKNVISTRGITQKELSDLSSLPTSTISDYVNSRTLISPGNLQTIADALKVSKSEIYPSNIKDEKYIKTPETSEDVREFNPFMIFDLVDDYSDDEIIDKFHHTRIEGGIDEKTLRSHLQHVRFLKTQQ